MGILEKKKKLSTRAADLFELPFDTVAGFMKVTITGCQRVLVENHKGILKYTQDVIEIGGDDVVLRIHGENMELLAMNRADLQIKGKIFSTVFE